MTLVNETTPIRLRDYRHPAWRVEAIELEIDLGIDATEVSSRLTLRSDPARAMTLLQTLAHEVHHLREVWPGRPRKTRPRAKRRLS